MVRYCAVECCNKQYKCCNYKCHNDCNYFHFNEFYISEYCIYEDLKDKDDNCYECIKCIIGTPITLALDIITCPFRCWYYCYSNCHCVKIQNRITIVQQPTRQSIQTTITEQPKNIKTKTQKFSDKPPNYNQHHKDNLVLPPISEELPPLYSCQ